MMSDTGPSTGLLSSSREVDKVLLNESMNCYFYVSVYLIASSNMNGPVKLIVE